MIFLGFSRSGTQIEDKQNMAPTCVMDDVMNKVLLYIK